MDELAKRFADLAEKYGPKVADAALAAARTEAYSALAAGTLAAAIGVVGLYIARMIWRHSANLDKYDAPFLKGAAIFTCVIATIPIISGIWTWVDPWTWVTISNPELWIAKRAFRL